MVRTIDDLDRAVRAIAQHFQADTVVIIGSQAVLMDWPNAPELLRSSGEIDAYPENSRAWEMSHPGDIASEEINALFGWGSHFHEAHGFYIDGVDDATARLPRLWRERALHRPVAAYGRTVTAIAPERHDLAAAKMHRLDPKDVAFLETHHRARPYDLVQLWQVFVESEPSEFACKRAEIFVASLA